MSALLFCLALDEQPISKPLVERMFGALDHFGQDGRELRIEHNFAIGYQRFWTVPEEEGEQQPLHDALSNTWLVFYGRLDNREHLLERLSIDSDLPNPDIELKAVEIR